MKPWRRRESVGRGRGETMKPWRRRRAERKMLFSLMYCIVWCTARGRVISTRKKERR
jgi:hypothetical protein